MKFVLLIFSLFFLNFSLLFGAEIQTLENFLSVDRFHTYLQRWSMTMEGRDQEKIAEFTKTITPEYILSLKLSQKKLQDAFNYDQMILEILQKKYPNRVFNRKDLEWNYNFYKKKLNEAYTISAPTKMDGKKVDVIEVLSSGELLKIETPDADDLLLNADGYVSGRITRGIFWEASESNRLIELHVGSAGDFKKSLAERGGKIIGQIKTVERNYNPIYLIEVPGDANYHYAITELSGADRVRHFGMQSNLIQLKSKKQSVPKLELFGNAESFLVEEERSLTQVLNNLPKADKVIIGQKGAIERTIRGIGKAKAILEISEKYPREVEAVLSADLKKVLAKAIKDPSILEPHTRNQLMNCEKLYDSIEPLFEKLKVSGAPNFTVFDLDKGSYEVSDYLLEGKNGQVMRWRVFSNSWGDEVLPIARALKATGHNEVSYIGTAGALPDSNLKVGDLVIPNKAVDQDGNIFKIKNSGELPKEAKEIDSVVNVSSPFEEDKDWLGRVKKSSQAVEIETGYLASTFVGKNDKLNVYLLISDVVGVEGETLAEASSSDRQVAQHNVLSKLLEESKVQTPVQVPSLLMNESKIYQWIEEVAPNRDLISKFQLLRKAESLGLTDKKEVQKLVATEASFTTKRVEDVLNQADSLYSKIMDKISELNPRISIRTSFLDGSWNPAKGPVEIHLKVANLDEEAEVKRIIDEFFKGQKKSAKVLNFSVSKLPADKSFIELGKNLGEVNDLFKEIYKESAIGFGGLASTEMRTGGLKFVKVAPSQSGVVKSNLAYFQPNQGTESLLNTFKSDGGEKILKKEIERINAHSGANNPWEIKFSVVDEIKGGNLAQIFPEIEGKADNLTIHLKITPEGLKNPAVVMEELIHLDQITGAPVPWKANTQFKAFVHPYHWAEVVANAQAGSLNAIEKLARLEVEASRASELAFKFYKKTNLFDIKTSVEEIQKYVELRTAHAEELHADIAKQARAEFKKNNAAWEKSKKLFEDLESQKDKLNDLVARNDRKGVRKLVEKYLPWDIMEPTESKSWTEWLEAIENPDKSKVKLVFRGMYDDLVMRNADNVPYLMSTVLTKNQGSYTRRLRSLSTLREKFGQVAIRDSFSALNMSGPKNPTSISVMMSNHAVEALGSPFLSTASYDVATKFGPRQLGAFKIDERRLVLNALSPDKYMYQHEMLTPLFIFPDEVVHFHDYARNPVEGVGPRSPEVRKKHFIGELENKLGRTVSKAEISGVGDEKEFVKRSYARLRELILDGKKVKALHGAGCAIDSVACKCLLESLNGLLK